MAATALAVLVPTMPAHAQEDGYDPGEFEFPVDFFPVDGETDRPDAPDDGTGQPSRPGPTGGGQSAPPPNSIPASAHVDVVAPGGLVVVAPPSIVGTQLNPDEAIAAGLASGTTGVTAGIVGSLTVAANGAVTVTVTIPAGTPTGVYYIVIVGQNLAGETIVYIVDISVAEVAKGSEAQAAQLLSGPETTAGEAKTVRLSPYESRTPPPAVLPLLISEAREAEIVDAVVDGRGTTRIAGDRLVFSRAAPEVDSGRPLLAALLVGTIGGGAALLRRRPERKAAA